MGHEEILLEYENKAKANGFRFVFGVDEAGRGPLAGPVVAAAVLLKETGFTNRITDSKKLSAQQRERAFLEIRDRAWVGVGVIGERVIDEINILRAAHMAMAEAVRDLVRNLPLEIASHEGFLRSVLVLVDGNSFTADLPYAVETIVKGDAKSFSVAAASIIAKVTRDRIMDELDAQYPLYGFKIHKGYPTKAHRVAIGCHGLSAVHRKTFRSSHESS